jgi:peptidyl-prolyl cis-trans isomerase B (cyclophilin B)
VASSRDRQRKLARAKLDRQLARRAAAERRKRRVRAGIGAGLAVILVALGSTWLLGGFEGEPENTAAADQCSWTTQDSAQNADLKDVGTPATKDLPTEGTRVMTVVTEGGDLTIDLDVAASQCGTASLAYLAEKNFYDNTKCHELTDTFLRCGDPGGSGQGGPAYTFFGENVPAVPEPSASASASPPASPAASPPASAPPGGEVLYPRGTVALVAVTPGNYGSQFLVFHKDLTTAEPAYSIVGRVLGGLPVLDKIVKAGTVDDGSGAKVKPAKDVVLKELRVGEAGADDEAPSSPPAGASPSATAQS